MPSVKIVEKGNISGIFEFVNDNKTNVNSCLLQKLKEPNAVGWDVWDVVAEAFGFLEREGVASL